MRKLILASQSPARRQLLSQAGISHTALSPGLDEAPIKQTLLDQGYNPDQIALALAKAKAETVSRREPDAVVIGADQTLSLEGRLFDKPESAIAAVEQLRSLNGRTHILHTAVAAAQSGDVVWVYEARAKLAMRRLSDGSLERYVESCGPEILGCVGAYQLEGLGVKLFEAIEGDYFSILGLPLLPLLAFLRTIGLSDL